MPSRQSIRGITLLESLVAILVIALGIFSVLGIQLRTLSDAQAGIRRSQAIRLIEDLSERINANPQASEYLDIYTANPPKEAAKDCSTPCTPEELAKLDIQQWHRQIQLAFGSGRAIVFQSTADADSTHPMQLGVLVAWKENQREGSNAAETEALNSFLKISATDASNQTCPEQYVCHLQYISIPRHCAVAGEEGRTSCT